VPTVFTKNRDRLLQHAVAHSFFQRLIARAADLMSDEHFTVDGTLLEAWASQKASNAKTVTPMVMGGATSGDRTGRTTPMRRPRIPTPGCIGSRTTPTEQ
jgi:hypothetical protein